VPEEEHLDDHLAYHLDENLDRKLSEKKTFNPMAGDNKNIIMMKERLGMLQSQGKAPLYFKNN
jgi:hypothetical protein